MSSFEKRNIKSFRTFRQECNGVINLIKNPKKDNSFFLATPKGTVAVGPGALSMMQDNNVSNDEILDTLEYHEFKPTNADGTPIIGEDGQPTWIPCVVRPSTANVVRSF